MLPDPFSPQLVMKRPNLNGLEPVVVPKGYSLRSFRDGEETAWETIIAESFEQTIEFDTRMRSDPAFQPERILFITRGDTPVATASAWYMDKYGPDLGYIHMVGVLPSHQGKKLGYWVNLAALHYFAAENRKGAVLQTDDFRRAAIKTYIRLGFEPCLVHENQRERWNQILATFHEAETYRIRFEKNLTETIHPIPP
ncbi:MAG: GNAT family N-acetyltransferase [Phycisphaerae bacterium]|nr:GNAT family N-acetyltransferase [Phycisphaerae bacterium]